MKFQAITAKNFLRVLRKSEDVNQTEVAKFLGISRPTLIKLETGKTSPTVIQCQLYATLFNLPPEYIFNELL